ncbi:MAG TPA: flagellar basal body L-ring protein FlgH [Acidiferrobacteraceae bacterium]|nr:flagellar basal body L-ring protein FlgH [Acidiferrobacteraceae bacterium]
MKLSTTAMICVALQACVSKPIKPDPAFAITKPQPAISPPISNGSIYQVSRFAHSLFADERAHRVGDVLTVILTENTSSNKSSNTSTKKENGITIPNPTVFGKQLPQFKSPYDLTLQQDLSSTQEFTGEGSSTQTNTLTGTVTVTVAEVLANGNLFVRGEKLLTLNQGDEFIRISGVVRQRDITPDNTVQSTQLANVRLVYGGTGALADANANGWMGRFFQSKWWPF